MNSTPARIALAALAVLVLAAPAHAQFESMMGQQQPKPLHFWLGGGVSFPVSGTFKDAFDNGFNGRGMISYKPAGFPIGFRADFSFQKFDLESVEVSGGVEQPGATASTQMLSALGNFVYGFKLGSLRPYVSAGVGAFSIKQDFDNVEGDDDDTQVEFGINGAAGIQFNLSKSLMLFAEGRLDNVYSDEGFIAEENIQVVPITFGIIF